MTPYLSAVVIGLAAALLLESVRPARALDALEELPRWLGNLVLSALSIAVGLLTPTLLWTAYAALGGAAEPGGGWGGLRASSSPVIVQWVLTFALMEALGYALHRLAHHVPWLWRLHAVHHSDPHVDATTTHRHHPLESLVNTALALPVLVAVGPPVEAVLAYSMLHALVSAFSHANLRLPSGLERVLSPLIATPGYHRVHHSATRPWTNTRYANVFPVFDRLFGTHAPDAPRADPDLLLGLDSARADEQRLDQLLLAPLRPQTLPAAPRAPQSNR